MFTEDSGATKSYRALARGKGCGWVRAYQVSQASRLTPQRPESVRSRDAISRRGVPRSPVARNS
jgi:hypothetical protein